MNIYQGLPKPFFVLAPMDDVTDTVFRQVVAGCAAPDLFFTEFVNVDGLQSIGRENLLKRIQFSTTERPIVAQIWGKDPKNYYKTSKELVEMGFAGIDINMGCPIKNIVNNGCCSAFIQNRDAAVEVIKAVQDGAGQLPVSVKTRLGFNDIDYSWHELLLRQNLSMLTIHGRTRKELSSVPNKWDSIGKVRELRDEIAPQTLIIGNGDVLSRQQGLELADEYKLDGIMIGRGIFSDPFIFAEHSPWSEYTRGQRIEIYLKHVRLFAETWKNNERRVATLNKFCKVYINGFDGAKELREKLMGALSTDELCEVLTSSVN